MVGRGTAHREFPWRRKLARTATQDEPSKRHCDAFYSARDRQKPADRSLRYRTFRATTPVGGHDPSRGPEGWMKTSPQVNIRGDDLTPGATWHDEEVLTAGSNGC